MPNADDMNTLRQAVSGYLEKAVDLHNQADRVEAESAAEVERLRGLANENYAFARGHQRVLETYMRVDTVRSVTEIRAGLDQNKHVERSV